MTVGKQATITFCGIEKERFCCRSCHQLSRAISKLLDCSRLGPLGGTFALLALWLFYIFFCSGFALQSSDPDPDPAFISCFRSELYALLLTLGEAACYQIGSRSFTFAPIPQLLLIDTFCCTHRMAEIVHVYIALSQCAQFFKYKIGTWVLLYIVTLYSQNILPVY